VLSIDHPKDTTWIRILNGISLICACAALFLLVADLGEAVDWVRLGLELTVIVGTAGWFAWSWAK